MSSNGISNKMHSQMCILRTSQTPLQGACSWEGIPKNSNMLAMKWLKIWVYMGIIGLQRFIWNTKDESRHICGIRSTQSCESINAYLNRFLKICFQLYDFVQQFDKAIKRIHHNEAKAEFESNNSSPILLTKLVILENHVANMYTPRNPFSNFTWRWRMRSYSLW